MRAPIVYTILDIVNGMAMPDIAFTNGNINQNTIYAKIGPDDLVMQPIPDENALFFQISNIEIDFSSKKFSYNPPLTPAIKGNLMANVTGATFTLTVQVLRLRSPTGRLLP